MCGGIPPSTSARWSWHRWVGAGVAVGEEGPAPPLRPCSQRTQGAHGPAAPRPSERAPPPRHPRCKQVHLRHLVGGRARGPRGELAHERVFQVGVGGGVEWVVPACGRLRCAVRRNAGTGRAGLCRPGIASRRSLPDRQPSTPAQVDFPERPGALSKFLGPLSPRWNVTLFHYRRTGAPLLQPRLWR